MGFPIALMTIAEKMNFFSYFLQIYQKKNRNTIQLVTHTNTIILVLYPLKTPLYELADGKNHTISPVGKRHRKTLPPCFFLLDLRENCINP
jgi:hypothetical protein